MNYTPSTRAQIITRRTYNRPLDEEGTDFETWAATVDRVIDHQRWLWERAQGYLLTFEQHRELNELHSLMMDRKISTSGRTLWLGGTKVARTREASQFNCAFARTTTVHDAVDNIWLLLQGCGDGFMPVPGTLNGFAREIPEVYVIRSKLTKLDWEDGFRGDEYNRESYQEGVWTIRVGDSAESWAKAVGKLLAGKNAADKLVLDFSQIRAPGIRLKGYGWISSGDEQISKAFVAIAQLMSNRAGQLLSSMDILDLMNWLGTILSSRRSSEIALLGYDDPEAKEFAEAKKDHYETGNAHRGMSNNSLVFHRKPSHAELADIFKTMEECGGSEPGFVNAVAAKKRAPWFKGVNPCGEILLGDKSFCNLVETDLGKFNGDWDGLNRAHYLAARANYRQTCVNLDDGVLQRTWHELNEFLRLCGVGTTGILRWDKQDQPNAWGALRQVAIIGVNSMADELGLPRAKAVTTIKPSGTLSKIMDTTEGIHKPLGKYILNNVVFSSHDPLVAMLKEAGYRTFENPYDSTSTIATIPVSYEEVEFDKVKIESDICMCGVPVEDHNIGFQHIPVPFTQHIEVNLETAIDQLERYKMVMENYVDHNCSITVSYDLEEVPAIIDWILDNWDLYVGVSFLYRNDPTKTAADLGYPYLPQEVVTKEAFDLYVANLSPIDLDKANSLLELEDEECPTGACPVK